MNPFVHTHTQMPILDPGLERAKEEEEDSRAEEGDGRLLLSCVKPPSLSPHTNSIGGVGAVEGEKANGFSVVLEP